MSMLVTDLDGTLLDSSSRLSEPNRRALQDLGSAGVIRVVATGRSFYSALQALDADFPIDYLVFSTGAGIVRWSDRELLASHAMTRADAERAIAVLLAAEFDFMVHHGVPDNHHFHFRKAEAENPDFDRRCARYVDFALPWVDPLPHDVVVSQLLVIEPAGVDSRYEWLRRELPFSNVVLTTSPLDHRSRWLEVFPPSVSKSIASDWLRQRYGLELGAVSAVGNDHNDTDMLEWAGQSYVVANAVEVLRSRHQVVSSNDEHGFAAVAARVLGTGHEQ